MDDSGNRRLLLQRQLDIMWRFAEEFILGQIDEDLALWESSTNVCTVRQGVESKAGLQTGLTRRRNHYPM